LDVVPRAGVTQDRDRMSGLDPFVELRSGLQARIDAIALGVDLERRGHVLSLSDRGTLQISAPERLSIEDKAAIRPLVRHLIALLLEHAPCPTPEKT